MGDVQDGECLGGGIYLEEEREQQRSQTFAFFLRACLTSAYLFGFFYCAKTEKKVTPEARRPKPKALQRVPKPATLDDR